LCIHIIWSAAMDGFLDKLVEILLYLPRLIYQTITDIFLSFINWIPVPISSDDIQTAIDNIPADLVYFLNVFEFDYGLTVCFGAYVGRFILRRIPGIG